MKWLWNENLRRWVWARCFAWVAVMVLLAAQQSRGAETNTIVIPPGAANEEGGSYGGPFSGPFEYQLAYHGSLFSPITSRIEITGVAWRVDGQGVGASFEVVVPRFEVWASTFQSPLSELSHIRAENWGADRINVFTGENVRFVGTGGSSPNSFDVKVVFDRPFPYEPGSGALLLDVESSGSFSKFAAAIDIGGDSLVAILGDDAFGPIIIHGAADVLEISYVPEPAVWVLVIVGLIPGCAGVGGRGSGYGAAGSRRVL